MVLILPLEELDLGKLCPCCLPKWSLFSTKETAEEENVLFVNIFRISKKPENLVIVKLLHLLLGFFSYFLYYKQCSRLNLRSVLLPAGAYSYSRQSKSHLSPIL